MYLECHTSYDNMKEYMILGAEFDGKYQMPILPCCHLESEPIDSVDFDESFSRKIKGHNKLNVNFYIDDCKFQRLWNNPDKYLDHLKCFHSVCGLDFTMGFGEHGMPFPLNVYNKYRNHALSFYLIMNGIKVIPSVSIPDKENIEWCLDGLPRRSALSVCTNGRVKAKASRIEFCEGFKRMCERLEPMHVIIVGRIPDELNTDVHLINFQTRNQKMNERLR